MSDFINWSSWARFRDSRNAEKARNGFVRYIKGPFNTPREVPNIRGKRGHGFRPAGSKLARKAGEGGLALTVGVVSKAYETMARNRRAA